MGDSALTIVTWVLFGVLVVLFITFIALVVVSNNATVSVSDALFEFPGLATVRFDDTSVSVWIKARYAGGTRESELPTQAQMLLIVEEELADITGDAPADTRWNILVQLIGEKIVRQVDPITAVSVQLKTNTAYPESAIYTQGGILPLIVS